LRHETFVILFSIVIETQASGLKRRLLPGFDDADASIVLHLSNNAGEAIAVFESPLVGVAHSGSS